MGFNTVALFLNDMMHILEKSPKTLTWALCHPPNHDGELEMRSWRAQIRSVADQAHEPMIHHDVLKVLPTFHADVRKWLFAGNNQILPLKFLRYSRNKQGKKLVVLELPNDWEGHHGWAQCPHTWIDINNIVQQCTLLKDHVDEHECDHDTAHTRCSSHKPTEIRG